MLIAALAKGDTEKSVKRIKIIMSVQRGYVERIVPSVSCELASLTLQRVAYERVRPLREISPRASLEVTRRSREDSEDVDSTEICQAYNDRVHNTDGESRDNAGKRRIWR